MAFNYEQSIWGRGYAGLSPADLASFRLRSAWRALDTVRSGGSVLEVGSGAGQFIRSIKKLRQDLDCFGCDISETAITLAREVPDGVIYAVSGERLPYDDASMDAVLIFDVLEHVPSPADVLREVYRVLKPGGVLYAYVPCEGDITSLWGWRRRFGCKNDLTRRHAGHINYFSRSTLRDLYRRVGFSSVQFRYSEHLLGQLLMFVAFNLMDRSAKRQGVTQVNGEEYFQSLSKSVAAPGLFSILKKIVNTLVYLESVVLNRVPSPNVHSIVRK
jgi:ubiquinone/menaquinone biosynthesis C-methylase UbiE